MLNTEALTYEVNWLPYVVPFSGVRTRNQKCAVWKTFSKICVFGNRFNPIYRGSQKFKSFAFSCENRIHVWTEAEMSIFLNSDDRSQPKEMAINLKSYYSALMGMLAYTEKKWQTDQTFDKKTEKFTFVSDFQAPDSCKDVNIELIELDRSGNSYQYWINISGNWWRIVVGK